MKPIVLKLLLQSYLSAVLPYEYERSSQVFDVITSHNDDFKIDIKFFEHTLNLIDFYVARLNFEDREEIQEVLKLIYRFIELGYMRDLIGVRNLYRSFTNPQMTNHNNRKFFHVSDTMARIVRRKEGDGITY